MRVGDEIEYRLLLRLSAKWFDLVCVPSPWGSVPCPCGPRLTVLVIWRVCISLQSLYTPSSYLHYEGWLPSLDLTIGYYNGYGCQSSVLTELLGID